MHKIPKFQNPWGPINTGSQVKPYQNWFNKSMNSTLYDKNPVKIPLDFTAKTLQGAFLPKRMQEIKTAKLDIPKFPGSTTSASGDIAKTDWLSKAFTATPMSKGLNVAGAAFDLAGSIAKPLDHVSGVSNALGVAGDIAGMIPGPWGQGISAGLKAIKLVDQLTGKKAATQATAGETATGYNLDFNANAGTSYGGLFGNKKRKQSNTLIGRQDTANIGKIGASRSAQQQMLGATNSMQDITNKNYQKLSGGLGTNVLAAKEGLKLIKQKAALMMKEGGTFNVIPSGALHAHKHNLPNEVADGLTKKGIPVIMEDGGEITQQAEIEREEIIFNLDLTKKLEELLKKFEDGDEEAAIEAGKLLTYEILENTQDNVGLINKIE